MVLVSILLRTNTVSWKFRLVYFWGDLYTISNFIVMEFSKQYLAKFWLLEQYTTFKKLYQQKIVRKFMNFFFITFISLFISGGRFWIHCSGQSYQEIHEKYSIQIFAQLIKHKPISSAAFANIIFDFVCAGTSFEISLHSHF